MRMMKLGRFVTTVFCGCSSPSCGTPAWTFAYSFSPSPRAASEVTGSSTCAAGWAEGGGLGEGRSLLLKGYIPQGEEQSLQEKFLQKRAQVPALLGRRFVPTRPLVLQGPQ